MKKKLSPCTKICEIDYNTGLCKGCYRTLEEISKWIFFTEEEKESKIKELKERKSKLK